MGSRAGANTSASSRSVSPVTAAMAAIAARYSTATTKMMNTIPTVFTAVSPQPVRSAAMSSQIELRVKPSKVVEPSTTRMNATEPRLMGSAASPARGARSLRAPPSRCSGAMADSFVNSTPNPSASRSHPRPRKAAPTSRAAV